MVYDYCILSHSVSIIILKMKALQSNSDFLRSDKA